MSPVRITTVRTTTEVGRQLLLRFLDGDTFTSNRPPRGIEPQLVAGIVVERLRRDTGPRVFARALELVRFYETSGVVPHVCEFLGGGVSSPDDLVRGLFAAAIVAELGSAEEAGGAAKYFDDVLVPSPEARRAFEAMIGIPVVLAPAGSIDKLAARLGQVVEEMARGQDESEAQMMAFDKLAAIERNDLPRVRKQIAAKIGILAQATDARRAELVSIYLRNSPVGGSYLETWSARMLRREAIEADPAPAIAELTRAVDSAPTNAFLITRAGQAIVYFKGRPSEQHMDLFQEHVSNVPNFLWDDDAWPPVIPPLTNPFPEDDTAAT